MPNNKNVHQLKIVPKVTEETKLDADLVLGNALGQLNTVLLIGKTQGGEMYISATTANKPELLYMLKEFETKLMNGDYD